MASSRPGGDAPGPASTRILYVARGSAGDVAERAIERLGATAVEAVGGTDALKRLAVGAIDAMVVPGELPDVSTATVVERAAAGESDVPVIVVGTHEPVPEPAIGLPGDVASAELADRLRRAIDRRREADPLRRYDRLESVVLRIVLSAVDAEDRRAVEASVREGLLEVDRYRDVWVGTTGPDRDGSLQGVPTPGGPIGAIVEATDEPIERAIEAGEVVLAEITGSDDPANTSPRGDPD